MNTHPNDSSNAHRSTPSFRARHPATASSTPPTIDPADAVTGTRHSP
ncbi:hypothetical protein [Lentzea aerocolonigenes]|nr:hypothetical protein [Lentzea aerocolonigenes]